MVRVLRSSHPIVRCDICAGRLSKVSTHSCMGSGHPGKQTPGMGMGLSTRRSSALSSVSGFSSVSSLGKQKPFLPWLLITLCPASPFPPPLPLPQSSFLLPSKHSARLDRSPLIPPPKCELCGQRRQLFVSPLLGMRAIHSSSFHMQTQSPSCFFSLANYK